MAKSVKPKPAKKPNRYAAIIGKIFRDRYTLGATRLEFSRDEFVSIAKKLGIELPKNLGDTIYSFRFRAALPNEIQETAGEGREWIIELVGRAKYRFRLAKLANITPNSNLIAIKI